MRISDWSSDVSSSDLGQCDIVRIADSVWQDCFGINFVLFDRPIRVHSSRSADRRAFFYGCQLPRACRNACENSIVPDYAIGTISDLTIIGAQTDRTSEVPGKRRSASVDIGGDGRIKKKKKTK